MTQDKTYPDDNGYPRLIEAALQGDYREAHRLLTSGADINEMAKLR